jgi:hypothetical protein
LVRAFEFEDNGLTFTCSVEKPRAGKTESWWWFGVAGDGNRYAPFQASAADTQESVRTRIVHYYTDRLARRAMPAVVRQHWASRGKGVVATSTVPATPATPATGPA